MAVFNQASTLVRRFLYRSPRVKTDISMDLILGDRVILGVCIDLSETGLRARLSHEVDSGAEGLVTLYQGERGFQVHAQVESLRNDEARVRFCFESDVEHEEICALLKQLAGKPASSQR